jgi:tryptophanyl-tRNA synthetase
LNVWAMRLRLLISDPAHASQEITPWDVQAGSDGKIDYEKLVRKFGCQMIDQTLIDRCEHTL